MANNWAQVEHSLQAISLRLDHLEKVQTDMQDTLHSLICLSGTAIVQLAELKRAQQSDVDTQMAADTVHNSEMEYSLESQLPDDLTVHGLNSQILETIEAGYHEYMAKEAASAIYY